MNKGRVHNKIENKDTAKDMKLDRLFVVLNSSQYAIIGNTLQ